MYRRKVAPLARLAPSERPTMKDIAWAAGIFEGEGHAFVHRTRRGATGQIVVTQKDRWILDRLKALFGGSVYVYTQGARDYTMSYWKLSGARGRGFLLTVFTWLSPRRRAQVRLAMAH